MEVCVGGKCRPEDRQCRATGISRLQRWWYASILPPYAASAAGSFQAVTRVVPGRDSSSSAGSVRRVPSLHSAVSLRLVYTWLLFLQALCLFRLVRGPRYAAVRARLQSHKAFRAARRQASRLLAQRVPTVIKMRRFSRKYTLRRSDSARLRLERSAPIRAVSRSGSGR